MSIWYSIPSLEKISDFAQILLISAGLTIPIATGILWIAGNRIKTLNKTEEERKDKEIILLKTELDSTQSELKTFQDAETERRKPRKLTEQQINELTQIFNKFPKKSLSFWYSGGNPSECLPFADQLHSAVKDTSLLVGKGLPEPRTDLQYINIALVVRTENRITEPLIELNNYLTSKKFKSKIYYDENFFKNIYRIYVGEKE